MSDSQGTPGGGERPRRRGRTFSFNINLGSGKPSLDDPEVRKMIEEAQRQADASADGVGVASHEQQLFSMEYADGKLRLGGEDVTPSYERPTDGAPPGLPAASSGWPAPNGFPDTDAIRRVLGWIKLVMVIAIPVALLVAGIASGYDRDTVLWMLIFGVVMSAMVAAMLPG
jgi:hypothetical protein